MFQSLVDVVTLPWKPNPGMPKPLRAISLQVLDASFFPTHFDPMNR